MGDAIAAPSQKRPDIVTLAWAAAFGALSMSIVLPSLPTIGAHFDAEPAIVQLAVTFYLWANAFLQLVIGPFSDRFGRRPVLLFFMATAIVAMIVSMFAPTIELFLACRLVQGTAAAGMVISRAAIRDTYGQDQSASMIGYVTMAMTLAPMLGPVAGGYLDEWLGWESTLLFTAVFGIIGFLLVWFNMPETNRHRGGNLLSHMKSFPVLARYRRFWGYALTAAFSTGCFYAVLGGGPFLAREHYHLSPSQYGLWFACAGIGYLSGNFLSGRFAVAIGAQRMMSAGCMIVMTAMVVALLLAYNGIDHPAALFVPIAFVGVGNGVTLPSANAGIVSVRPDLAGAASGFGGFLQIGLAAGISVLAGYAVGLQGGAIPLVLLVFASAFVSFLAALAVTAITRADGRLELAGTGETRHV